MDWASQYALLGANSRQSRCGDVLLARDQPNGDRPLIISRVLIVRRVTEEVEYNPATTFNIFRVSRYNIWE